MFQKNLSLLEKVNPNLANKVLGVALEDASEHIGAVKNENGEYILIRDKKYIDDTPSPLNSAKDVYEKQVKTAYGRHDFIIIFGLGLGNLLDYVHRKSITTLILYESDLNILRFTLEYVDLSKYFSDGRLFITDNIKECCEYLEQKYLLDDKIEFVYLKNYVAQHPSEFTLLTDKIYETCKRKIIDMNTTKVHSKIWIENTFENLKENHDTYPINILEDKFKGKTALVIGAGPSLKDNLEKIKENRDKYVIFAVHRPLETLCKNGITPDFCIVVDTQWVSHSIYNDMSYLAKINFITDIKSDKFINKLPKKTHFIYYPETSSFSKKLEAKFPDDIKCFETGGTSTITAYNCAKFMGCKEIIFAGIDLAFKDDTVYCDGKIAATHNSHSVIIQNVLRESTKVKSITGEYVSTREDYANFIYQFENLFARDTNINKYNLTTFGAFIQGMTYCSLEEVLEKIKTEEIGSIDEVLKNAINKSGDLQKRIEKEAFDIIQEERKKIDPIVDNVREWFEMYSEHPSFFDYATKIFTSITSTMILQEYLQIELIRFIKLVTSKDNETKKQFVKETFENILKYEDYLNNLI